MTDKEVLGQLKSIISDLIKFSLSDGQNYPAVKSVDGSTKEISFKGADKIAIALRELPYAEIYDELKRNCAYSVRMLDGAMVQMSYRFTDQTLTAHRLAFFPSPHLESFQNEPLVYMDDELFADVRQKSIVPFPLRFDFDVNNFEDLDHPKSHLTLGQFRNCRIPVSAPLSPFQFVSFLLRSFYNTAHRKYSSEIVAFTEGFPETIGTKEQEVVHVRVH